MNINKIILDFLIGILICIISSCQFRSDKEEIANTIHLALKCINNKDYEHMRDLIGIYSPSDTSMEFIIGKVNRVDYFIDKFYDGEINKLTIRYSDSLDELQRLKVIIPLFNGFDSTTGTLEANLYLYVGPSVPVPLNKLSGFDFEAKYDKAWRRQLDFEGKLPNMDNPIKN